LQVIGIHHNTKDELQPHSALRYQTARSGGYYTDLLPQKGILEKGFTFAGANTYRIDKIISVKKLIETLLMEYENATVIGVRLEA